MPFYFCPRSVMLYLLHKGNAPGLDYKGGQRPIVHLEADFHEVVRWAEEQGRLWAISPANAGAKYTNFYNTINDLNRIRWSAVGAGDFRDPAVKEAKQSEFLLLQSFPWSLVRRIGVIDAHAIALVKSRTARVASVPPIEVHEEWYY